MSIVAFLHCSIVVLKVFHSLPILRILLAFGGLFLASNDGILCTCQQLLISCNHTCLCLVSGRLQGHDCNIIFCYYGAEIKHFHSPVVLHSKLSQEKDEYLRSGINIGDKSFTSFFTKFPNFCIQFTFLPYFFVLSQYYSLSRTGQENSEA